ncbi:MAG: hypothetical protein GY821_09195 [Gammaproteobacteria bacterium]|nr:hypothetical protein [Gammaproteobacteria bacterium]
MKAGYWKWDVETAAPQPLSKVKENKNGKSIAHYDGKSKTDKARKNSLLTMSNGTHEAALPKITTTHEITGYAQMNQNIEMVKICGFGLTIKIWTWHRLR